MHETNWYLVYTRQGQENKLAGILTAKSIINYCPLNKLNQRWLERGHVNYRPLFPGYVFVCLKSANIPIVKAVRGIVNFVFWLGAPAVIPDDEILAIKCFLDEYAGIRIQKIPVNPDERHRVIYGPLVIREGSEFEVRNSPVSVILPTLGYTLIAEERKRTAVNFKLQGKLWGLHKKVS